MYTIKAMNVEEAFSEGVKLIHHVGVAENSRNGSVLVAPCPVMTVYQKPNDRVLLSRTRKSNHAFHINEAIWMLSGSNDARWLDQFVHDFSTRYAREDGTLDGAYGARWRRHFSARDADGMYLDQIEEVVRVLRKDSTSRRAVIAMHDPVCDLNVDTLDQPCNTHIYFRIYRDMLDMTVMCRSNDIIWGAYGANAVHFSVLQEYVAAAVDIPIGRMYQFSNNWHAYTNVLDKIVDYMYVEHYDTYIPMPLVTDVSSFIGECERWVSPEWDTYVYANEWFTIVLYPIRAAYLCCKEHEFRLAHEYADSIKDFKWRKGMIRWIEHKERLYVQNAG